MKNEGDIMVYLDTSFIVPYYIYEASSVQVNQIMVSLPIREVSISNWTLIEFASMLARKIRMREISVEVANYVFDSYDEEIRSAYEILMPTPLDYHLAVSLLRRPDLNLRAGDAFHLAIAKNNQINMLLSLDEGMLKAASLLEIPAGKSL
jgi:predicted nucleic acid-binding protein